MRVYQFTGPNGTFFIRAATPQEALAAARGVDPGAVISEGAATLRDITAAAGATFYESEGGGQGTRIIQSSAQDYFSGAGTTGTTGTTGATGGFGLGGGSLSDVDINAAFRRALATAGLGQLGRQPTNLAERFAQGRAGAGIAAFNLEDALRGIRGEESQEAETFFGENFGRFGERAGQSFSDLQQIIAARQNPAGGKAGIPIFDDPALQNLVNPLDDEAGAISFDAARAAFRNRFSPIVANALGGRDSLGSALTDFRASTGGEGGNFIESLRRRFGLQRFAQAG